jgi:hypothetical protein
MKFDFFRFFQKFWALTVRVYVVGNIFCTIDYHICWYIFGRIDIMYCRLPYVSRGALPLKTPAPLYICTSIKQYNHLTFDGTPLSNLVIRAINFSSLPHISDLTLGFTATHHHP